MFGLGLPEIAVILIAFVIFFFGADKLSDLARGMGRFTGEFKKGKDEIASDDEEKWKKVPIKKKADKAAEKTAEKAEATKK